MYCLPRFHSLQLLYRAKPEDNKLTWARDTASTARISSISHTQACTGTLNFVSRQSMRSGTFWARYDCIWTGKEFRKMRWLNEIVLRRAAYSSFGKEHTLVSNRTLHLHCTTTCSNHQLGRDCHVGPQVFLSYHKYLIDWSFVLRPQTNTTQTPISSDLHSFAASVSCLPTTTFLLRTHPPQVDTLNRKWRFPAGHTTTFNYSDKTTRFWKHIPVLI